jgi:D-alanyl-D-alanine carboxypeptidase/D-alanyl-D-alanine-endopeptidase (penicillin-binding protein 4)
MSRVRRILTMVCVLSALAAALPAAASAGLAATLTGPMRAAGSQSGAYVLNATTGKAVFRYRPMTPRVLASNTKLFTTTAALARFGTAARLATEVRGTGTLDDQGTYSGNLYLIGGGDPTFGSTRFAKRAYGGGGSVESLAARLQVVGVRKVTGRIYGDETRFDSLRGGPDSRFGVSPYVGPLSALDYNRGLASENGRGFQADPPAFAAARLDAALAADGVSVRGAPRAGPTPPDAIPLVKSESPTMARMVRLTNKPSDNFFAEMLVKDLALQAKGKGTTRAGARLAATFAKRLGGGPRSLVDGSGLSHADRASPYRVARLLQAMRGRDEFSAFYDSLSIAGRDGTLRPRMRGGPARGRCRGKTGTLSGVSALSGYCTALSGDVYVFSILMNGVNTAGARGLQDRMVQAIAGAG